MTYPEDSLEIFDEDFRLKMAAILSPAGKRDQKYVYIIQKFVW